MLALVALGTVGSVVGLGIQLWTDPLTSLVTIAHGAVMGVLVAHAWGESLVLGLALGGIVALFALGLAAFGSLLRTVRSPASLASPSWFAR